MKRFERIGGCGRLDYHLGRGFVPKINPVRAPQTLHPRYDMKPDDEFDMVMEKYVIRGPVLTTTVYLDGWIETAVTPAKMPPSKTLDQIYDLMGWRPSV